MFYKFDFNNRVPSHHLNQHVLRAIAVILGVGIFCLVGSYVVNAAMISRPAVASRPFLISDPDPIGGSITLTSPFKKPVLKPDPVRPALCEGDYMKCTILNQIAKTDAFLRNNKNGLAYTPDAREANLTPYPEVVRLLIDSQAIGYLNLYETTKNQLYLQEAKSRLDYIISQGDVTLRNASYDGQVGWSMLRAYALTKQESYRVWGMRIADACTQYHDTMNIGYMCALTLGQAYQLTGNSIYLDSAREVTRNTSDKQFDDGAFPHRDRQIFGENTGYTAWMVYEMINYRRDDATNPNVDYAVINAARFLEKRISPDGSVNYEDADGTYYSDPGNADGRGWMADPVTIAYIMHAFGKDTIAMNALNFTFQHQLTGPNAGSYPDKWEFVDQSNPWTTGSPSVIRTSIIFMFLTDILRVRSSTPANGSRIDCAVTPDDCHPAFQELGLCSAGLTGHRTTFDGVTTKCLNAGWINSEPQSCTYISSCVYDERDDSSDYNACPGMEDRICNDDVCTNTCHQIGNGEQCERTLAQGNLCT